MPFFRFGMSMPSSVFAPPCAVWRYDACSIAKRGIASVGGAGAGNPDTS
jgi:hypothetical protein